MTQDNSHELDRLIMQETGVSNIQKVRPLLNQTKTTVKSIADTGSEFLNKREIMETNYKPNKMNRLAVKAILEEFSQDKYESIGQVFRKNQDNLWPSQHIFLNWMVSADPDDELVQEFMRIQYAKDYFLEDRLLERVRDSSNDFVKDENGSQMLDSNNNLIKNDPHLARLKLEVNILQEKNKNVNPIYGKMVQAKVEAKRAESTAEKLAEALAIFSGNKEKEIQGEVIDSEKNED